MQGLIFLIRCGKNPVIYDDPTPLSSFQYHSSIQSLILTLFDSVLGPKKNPSNQSRELGLYPSRGRIFCLHVRYSNGNILSFWYRNQVIQKSKFIYVWLKLWWRSRSEIKSFYRTESSSNLVGRKGSPGLTQKLTNAESPDMTESMN